MDMLGFNIDSGFVEAVCRGMRSGFLTESNYDALRNCSNITDFKMVLEETDYAFFI